VNHDSNLEKASKDHILNMGPSGATGHTGLDGSSPFDRLARYTEMEATAGESISYGQHEPIDVILQLAIDDGVSTRGHRNNLFNAAFVKAGVFSGDHKAYGKSTVILYNGSWGNQHQN
jgi:uncharacterized protein YkwD